MPGFYYYAVATGFKDFLLALLAAADHFPLFCNLYKIN